MILGKTLYKRPPTGTTLHIKHLRDRRDRALSNHCHRHRRHNVGISFVLTFFCWTLSLFFFFFSKHVAAMFILHYHLISFISLHLFFFLHIYLSPIFPPLVSLLYSAFLLPSISLSFFNPSLLLSVSLF